MTTGPFYREEELQRALHLFNSGLSWRVVAERLGRPRQGLKKSAHRYRNGTWAPHRLAERCAEIDQRAEALVASGVTTAPAIGRALGLKPNTMQRRLYMLGLDAEMRRELAAEHQSRGA